MTELYTIDVTQIRLYPADRVPFESLLVPRNFTNLIGRLQAQPADSENAAELSLVGGQVEDGDLLIPLKRLRVNSQRILLTVGGNSELATRAFQRLSEFLGSLDASGKWGALQPVVLTEETACVVGLNFDWTALFREAFINFIHAPTTQERIGRFCEPELKRFNLSFTFGFRTTPTEFIQRGLNLKDKVLTIEPRLNTPLAEHIYYTASPTDSETHLNLLRDLEEALLREETEQPSAMDRKAER